MIRGKFDTPTVSADGATRAVSYAARTMPPPGSGAPVPAERTVESWEAFLVDVRSGLEEEVLRRSYNLNSLPRFFCQSVRVQACTGSIDVDRRAATKLQAIWLKPTRR